MFLDKIPEEEPCYYFEADIYGTIKGYVYANDEEGAREKIHNMDIDDKMINDLNIDNITRIYKEQ